MQRFLKVSLCNSPQRKLVLHLPHVGRLLKRSEDEADLSPEGLAR